MRNAFCYLTLLFYLLNEAELFSKYFTKKHVVLIKIIAVCGFNYVCLCI